MEEDREVLIIVGRPFLAIGNILIDVQQDKLTLRVQDDEVAFNIFKAMKYPMDNEACFQVHMLEKPEIETMIMPESQIDDSLSNKAFYVIKTSTTPWYADIVNYLACDIIPLDFSYRRKKKFFADAKYYQ